MEFLTYDPVAQAVTYHRVTLDARGTTLRPLRLRYCWANELDLMVPLDGMRLRERYQDRGIRPQPALSPRRLDFASPWHAPYAAEECDRRRSAQAW